MKCEQGTRKNPGKSQHQERIIAQRENARATERKSAQGKKQKVTQAFKKKEATKKPIPDTIARELKTTNENATAPRDEIADKFGIV